MADVLISPLVIAELRRLHSQLQAVACVLTAREQTAVAVIVLAGRRLRGGGDLTVVGAAASGEDHVIEPAEETVQNNSCTVN